MLGERGLELPPPSFDVEIAAFLCDPAGARDVTSLALQRLGGRVASYEDLAGRRVFAFAGIGRPEKFFSSLERLGLELVGRRAFADHHPYSGAEVRDLLDQAAALEAVPATTEKDAVRLSPEARRQITVVALSVIWRDRPAVEDLLGPVVRGGRSVPNRAK